MRVRIAVLVLGALILCSAVPHLASAGTSPRPQYVLKHPGKERCKANYVKKVKTIKVRKRGKVRKVRRGGKVRKVRKRGRFVKRRKTFCVYTGPSNVAAPVPPAPGPPPPQGTATTLTVKFRGCEYSSAFAFDLERCAYAMSVAVTTAAGAPITSPAPSLEFTNPEAPGKVWTVVADTELGIYAQRTTVAANEGSELLQGTAIVQATEGPFGEERTTTIANASGHEPWAVVARYAGSAGYLTSVSSPPRSL